MTRRTGALITGLLIVAGCGRQIEYRAVGTGTAGATSVTLSTATGTIQPGRNQLQLTFSGVGEQPKDVRNPNIVIRLGGPPIAGVRSTATIQQMPPLSRVGPGVFRTRYDINFDGPYQFIVTWSDAGKPQSWTFSTRTPVTQQAPNAVDQVGGPPGASPAPVTAP
jgi:hypothetical protein